MTISKDLHTSAKYDWYGEVFCKISITRVPMYTMAMCPPRVSPFRSGWVPFSKRDRHLSLLYNIVDIRFLAIAYWRWSPARCSAESRRFILSVSLWKSTNAINYDHTYSKIYPLLSIARLQLYTLGSIFATENESTGGQMRQQIHFFQLVLIIQCVSPRGWQLVWMVCPQIRMVNNKYGNMPLSRTSLSNVIITN